jgi:aspartyl-tRNA(Asn)/glutamyl-tRNA(Gln) amidotransferase subunit C
MPLSREQVEHIARLARLRLTPEETAKLSHDLAQIVAWIDQLQAVEIPAERADATTSGVPDRLREDTVQPSLSQKQALANAPDADDQFFRVPRVIG